VHLVGFIIRISHDALSHERKNTILFIPLLSHQYIFHIFFLISTEI